MPVVAWCTTNGNSRLRLVQERICAVMPERNLRMQAVDTYTADAPADVIAIYKLAVT